MELPVQFSFRSASRMAAHVTLLLSLLCFSSLTSAQTVPLTPEEQAQLDTLTQQEVVDAITDSAGSAPEDQAQIAEPVSIAPRPVTSAEPNDDAIQEDARERQLEEEISSDVELQSTASQPLQQFGYELFAGTPSTFAPATNIPVPDNYAMGPGDTVIIQLYGQRNLTHELVITREGMLMFPEIGPVSVAGLNFDEMRAQIQSIVANQLIGQNATVTLGALRSINIFVMGEAFRPGSYTVSSLSTMTNALFVSGGVTRVGSLRNIRLMRNGELVTVLDLYDLLLRGDTSADARLMPGDVIFIPPIGKTVGVAGDVKRPAIFELNEEVTAADVLVLSGGFLPTAFPSTSRIERINERGERTLIDVDLSTTVTDTPAVADGDVIQIFSILDEIESVVMLEGHVHRPGGFQWREGLRITDILSSIEEMLPNPDLEYALVAREVQPTRRIEMIYVNLREVFANPGSDADLLFQPRDQLFTFGAAINRQSQVEDLLRILRSQATFDEPPQIVAIRGNVQFPGEYPLVRNMTLDHLVTFSGGLNAATDLDYVVFERRIDLSGTIEVRATSFDRNTLRTPTPVALQELDQVYVFNANSERNELLGETLRRLGDQAVFRNAPEIVSVSGNVRFPGIYPLHRDIQLADLLQASGGLTEETDLKYVILEREINELREIEVLKIEIDPYTLRPLQPIQLQPRDNLVIFNANAPREDLLSGTLSRLRNQVSFRVPPQIVSVVGNVRFPGAYPLHRNIQLAELLDASGGLTERTDLNYVLLERETDEFGRIEVLKIDLDPLTLRPLQPFELQPRDTLLVFNANTSRDGLLESTLNRLREQSDTNNPTMIVSITGNVRFPGNYPLHRDLDVSDLIQMAGGLTQSAETRTAEVTRYYADPSVGREIDHYPIDLQNSGENGRGFALIPFDQLVVRQMPNWTDNESVFIGGEVNAPGRYSITKEDTLSSLIQRAGGLTVYADAKAAIFLREELRQNEELMLNEFRDRLERDIVTRRLQQVTADERQVEAGGGGVDALLDRISTISATGRLVIDLPAIIASREKFYDVILRPNDQLLIPRTRQEISVIGEINRPTSHLYEDGLDAGGYVDKSGGFTDDADERNMFVIKSSGEVLPYGDAKWFFGSRGRIEAGDTIVVPFDATPSRGLSGLLDISQILFNLSTTLLAIERVRAN